jgi:hypothetical protein
MKKEMFSMIAAVCVYSCSTANRLTSMSENQARDFVTNWPAAPKMAADKMIAKYGAPHEVTETMLAWNYNGPWKRTIVYKQEVPHHFPMQHTDLLEQVIDYRVPVGKYDELARYDGSVIVERTKGEISARCDKEEMNFLALNLANDVATGKKTVEEARSYYARAAKEFMQGKMDPYVKQLQFNDRKGNTADPDSPAKM